MKANIFFILFAVLLTSANCKLSEYVKWQIVAYKNLPDYGAAPVYDGYANVPFGLSHYKNKLFVTIPRRNRGIPSTLNVVELNGSPPYINPLLKGYPNYQMNALNPNFLPDSGRIVSVYRPRVDRCSRLWFVDTGVLEYSDGEIVVQRPSIWSINLDSDTIVGRFEIPRNIAPNGKGFASLTIDDDDCSNTFAYIIDYFTNSLVVFSARQRKAWRFEHNYFFFNPFEGDFNIDGIDFQWNDGLFSLALSGVKANGYRTAFFHPLGSCAEFTVTTDILRNETLAARRTHGNDFKFLGQRGLKSNSGSHYFDIKNNIIFFTEMQNNAITCWNVKKPLKRNNIEIVERNDLTLIYPADLFIDNDSTLWVLSNRLPRFIYSRYNTSEYNFNIFRENVQTAISDTSCGIIE